MDFFKKNLMLNLQAERNRLGDVVVGYNRPALNRTERVSLEEANEWLAQDIEKARKEAAKYEQDKNEPVIFVLHYIGRRRWAEAAHFLGLVKDRQLVKAALVLSNSKWFKNNFTLAALLAQKIVKGEKTL